jgi:hypothetical protein
MTEAAQAIENRQSLPAHRMLDEKIGRPGESLSLMDELRIAFGGCAFSMGVLTDVFIDLAVGDGVEFSAPDHLPAIKLTIADSGTGARVDERRSARSFSGNFRSPLFVNGI